MNRISQTSFTSRLTRRVRATLLASLALSCTSHAASVSSPSVDAASNVDIRLESWLETRPHVGFAPVTLRIRNGDTQPHTWTFKSSNGYGMGGGLSSTVSLTVEAGRSGERVIYAPVTAQTDSGYYYGSLSFTVQGFGVKTPGAGALHHNGSYGGNRTEFIGMGRKLSAKHWSALRNRLDSITKSGSAHTQLHGSEVDMANAPDDWRGYSGLAQLWMDDSEWIGMRPAAKVAMLDWVAMGGHVIVLARDISDVHAEQLALPVKVNGRRSHGAGELTLMTWDGGALPLDSMVPIISAAGKASTRTHLGDYDKKWSLRELAGELTLKSGLIFGFIVVFGILVGPVNLFWLAPAGKRQRMFWTTPLLSLGGSLLLLVVMVLQDGVGGSGARLTLAILQPEQKHLAILQEQVSRTGVLLGRAFPIAETGWMQPLELTSSSTGFNPMREGRHSYAEGESVRNGDWFASRSVQAHLLQGVRPSRAAIEVFPPAIQGQPPAVLSSIESPLRKLFIVDEDNKVWMAEDVGTGEKKTTQPTTHTQLGEWLREGPKKFAGPVLSAAMLKLTQQTGCAFAEAADASKLAVPTLSSIRWTDDHAIIAGPFVKR